jgi:hypothetical protein
LQQKSSELLASRPVEIVDGAHRICGFSWKLLAIYSRSNGNSKVFVVFAELSIALHTAWNRDQARTWFPEQAAWWDVIPC